jgi:hypothetical protein
MGRSDSRTKLFSWDTLYPIQYLKAQNMNSTLSILLQIGESPILSGSKSPPEFGVARLAKPACQFTGGIQTRVPLKGRAR